MDTSANNGPVNIGEILNQTRVRRRLSVDEVSNALHIRRKYLLALEQNRWDDLPGEVYAQGFLKNYARYLDLNGEDLVEERRRQIGQPVDRPPLPPLEPLSRTGLYTQSMERSATSSQPPPKKRTNRHEKTEAPDYSSPSSLIWLLSALLVLFVGGLYLLERSSHSAAAPRHAIASGQTKKTPTSKKNQNSHLKATQTKKTPRKRQNHVTALNSVNVRLETTSQSGKLFFATYLVNKTPVQVNLVFTGACWTKAIINGVTQQQKIYYSGQKVSFTGTQSVDVILGSHYVTMHVDGKPVSLPSPSYVLDMTFQG